MCVLQGKFASSVFQSCKKKTPKTRKLVSGPQCVKRNMCKIHTLVFPFRISNNMTIIGLVSYACSSWQCVRKSLPKFCCVNFIDISFRKLLRAGREVNCISTLFKEF
jgi:hypothetical protein